MAGLILKAAASVAMKYAAVRRKNYSLQKQLNAALAGQQLQASVIRTLTRENEALRRKRTSWNWNGRDHEGRFTTTKSARGTSLATLPVRSTEK